VRLCPVDTHDSPDRESALRRWCPVTYTITLLKPRRILGKRENRKQTRSRFALAQTCAMALTMCLTNRQAKPVPPCSRERALSPDRTARNAIQSFESECLPIILHNSSICPLSGPCRLPSRFSARPYLIALSMRLPKPVPDGRDRRAWSGRESEIEATSHSGSRACFQGRQRPFLPGEQCDCLQIKRDAAGFQLRDGQQVSIRSLRRSAFRSMVWRNLTATSGLSLGAIEECLDKPLIRESGVRSS